MVSSPEKDSGEGVAEDQTDTPGARTEATSQTSGPEQGATLSPEQIAAAEEEKRKAEEEAKQLRVQVREGDMHWL